MPPLKRIRRQKVFGADGVFQLQDLLADTLGANLRNEVAHGLVNDNQMFGDDVLYLWWLFFRYCLLASEMMLRPRAQAAKVANEEQSA
jgi:hypothetical protein